MSDNVRIEQNYCIDEGECRAALVVDETVVATLTVENCFRLADDLVGAGERLVSRELDDKGEDE